MVGVDVAESRLGRAREELAQLEDRQQNLTIVSPAIGKIGLIHVRPGMTVSRGDELVELLDEAQRDLVVHVPSREITRFQLGDELALDFPGGAERTGRITSVSPQTQSRSPEADGDPIVLVRVEPTGAIWPDVPIGSLINVHPIQ
jgi:multidrug resistance efflux pump